MEGFCEKLNVIPDAALIGFCVNVGICKIRSIQGERTNLTGDLASFQREFLSEPNGSWWRPVEKIHLFALLLLVSNRHQAAIAYQQLNTARKLNSAENFIRRHPELFAE